MKTETFLFRSEVFDPPIDITGFDVESTDGQRVGRIDEATYRKGAHDLVVDTGVWIFGKKRTLPDDVVTRIDPVSQKVYVGVSKADIKQN
jgi:hypothetical protein